MSWKHSSQCFSQHLKAQNLLYDTYESSILLLPFLSQWHREGKKKNITIKLVRIWMPKREKFNIRGTIGKTSVSTVMTNPTTPVSNSCLKHIIVLTNYIKTIHLFPQSSTRHNHLADTAEFKLLSPNRYRPSSRTDWCFLQIKECSSSSYISYNVGVSTFGYQVRIICFMAEDDFVSKKRLRTFCISKTQNSSRHMIK